MSREIKFRAWLKKRKYMVEVISLDAGCITWDDNQIDRCLPPNKCYEIELLDDVELLQYTGLKDKNGVDIVEGDIVKWIDKCVILWDKETGDSLKKYEGISQIVWRQLGFDIEESSMGYEGESMISWHNLEVIGNIYENEDLLK
jgi:uncharacterized phage protein (TIGR01671 family)|tara:strand:- start:96 stop:527 length:432 start_codon:yes stop_codon:yes gene_type:complete